MDGATLPSGRCGGWKPDYGTATAPSLATAFPANTSMPSIATDMRPLDAEILSAFSTCVPRLFHPNFSRGFHPNDPYIRVGHSVKREGSLLKLS